MAPPSALVGDPPLTADDTTIVKGMQILFGMPHPMPAKGLRLGIKKPPPGVHHDTAAPGLLAGSVVMIVLMLGFTGTRLVIRATNRSLKFGWDDWAIIVALALALVKPIMAIWAVEEGGAGKHIYDVKYWELANYMKFSSSPSLPIFYVTLAVIKISIVLFYMRLSAFTSRKWMIAHWTFLIFLVICALISIFVGSFQCTPVLVTNVRAMARRGKPLKCLDFSRMVIGLNAWHIASDLLLLVVPVAMLWDSKMRWTIKLRVCLIGIVGLANCGLAIARAVIQAHGFDGDITYFSAEVWKWAGSEITLGIITASLPVLSVLVTRVGKKLYHKGNSPDDSPGRKYSFGRVARVFRSDTDTFRIDSDPNISAAGGPRTPRHDVEYAPTDPSSDHKKEEVNNVRLPVAFQEKEEPRIVVGGVV